MIYYPFFQARRTAAGFETKGSASFLLGHPLAIAGRRQGLFAEWEWDAPSAQLAARCDPLGGYPLFYQATSDVVRVSSSPIQLIAQGAPADLDYEALAVFFSIGWFLNEDTPFAGIKVLPPDGRLTWTAGRLEVTGRKTIWEAAPISRAAAVEKFIDRFHTAVGRQLAGCEGEVVVPLSGGRDSRHIVLEMARLGRKPDRCVTYSEDIGGQDVEAIAATKVAEAVGAVHEIIDCRTSPLRDQMRILLLTHFCTDEHAQCIPLHDHLPPDCALFDGIGGDVLSRNKGFTQPEIHRMCRTGDWAGVVDTWLLGGYDELRCGTFAYRVGSNTRLRSLQGHARDTIIETLRSFEAAADPYTAFLFWNRTRREIALAPAAVHAGLQEVRCPYLDLDLVEFLGSLPFEVTSDGCFHDAVIATEFPQYVHLPYCDDLEAVPSP